jgi:pimeloyl-ACP methyl ester carboxylesterase
MSPPQVSFFTTGRRLDHEDSYIIVDQSYIHYTPPIPHPDSSKRLPILFIHGGGLTGASWESTPDLRPGWAVLSSSHGYATYILDTVDSGRSARAPDMIRPGVVEHRTAKQVWTRFRFGAEDKFEERKLFKGSQFPVEAFDALLASQAARRRTNDAIELSGVIEAIRMIGECWVITHSHGAALSIDALSSVKDLVKQLVLVEPGGTSIASKLTPDVKTLVVWGDYLDDHEAWPLIAKPFEESPAEIVRLPNLGVKGNTHLPMCDQNSAEVFKMVLGWLEGKQM